MSTVRIALASLRYPATPEESVANVERAIAEAGAGGAAVVAFPECYVPGYRGLGHAPPAPDAAFLERAWSRIGVAAGRARVAAVIGSERLDGDALRATALVVGPDGARLGVQDKAQVDPSEDGIYAPGTGRRVFTVGPLTFGVVICHEGFRYPETVRAAVRAGAQLVFHPHLHEAGPGSAPPSGYGDPRGSFHEKAALCRAAENTSFYATINYASEGAPTATAIIGPDGVLLAHQPYGREGLLFADLDLAQATGLLARRFRPDAL